MNEYEKIIVTPLGTVSPYCKEEYNCPGFLINYKDERILLDCGNGITRLLNFPLDLNNLSIFISHFHKDHYGDLLSLGYVTYIYNKLGILKEPVKVYIPKTDSDNYYNKEDMLKLLYSDFHDIPSYFYDYFVVKFMKEHYFKFIEYDDKAKINIDDLKISFFKNKHSIPCYSTKLENGNVTIVYTSDTGYDSAIELSNFAFDADLLICDSTFKKSDFIVNDNHLNAYQASRIAILSNAKKLMLTHFWPEIPKEEYLKEAKMFFENTIVAQEGERLVLCRRLEV